MKNQKGFLSLTLLLTMIFIGGLFFLATAFSVISLKNSALYICRSVLLESQKRAQDKIQLLLAENIQAKILHAQEQMVRRSLRLAMAVGGPAAVASLQIELARIQAQLVLLDQKQKLLIQTSDQVLRQAVLLASQKVREFYSNDLLPQYLKAQVQITAVGNPKTSVKIASSHRVAPQYAVKKTIDIDQKQTLMWTTHITQTSARPLFNIRSMEEKCQVTSKFKRPSGFELAVSMGRY